MLLKKTGPLHFYFIKAHFDFITAPCLFLVLVSPTLLQLCQIARTLLWIILQMFALIQVWVLAGPLQNFNFFLVEPDLLIWMEVLGRSRPDR